MTGPMQTPQEKSMFMDGLARSLGEMAVSPQQVQGADMSMQMPQTLEEAIPMLQACLQENAMLKEQLAAMQADPTTPVVPQNLPAGTP